MRDDAAFGDFNGDLFGNDFGTEIGIPADFLHDAHDLLKRLRETCSPNVVLKISLELELPDGTIVSLSECQSSTNINLIKAAL